MRIVHTSEEESGQIYIPVINWLLFFSVVIVIVGFKHSSNLAAAYGIAVTGTMVLTAILCSTVAINNWRWNRYLVLLILVVMLCIDVSLFSANLVKVFSGGWLPLTLALMMFIVMTTWKSERFRLLRRMHEHGNSLEAMIASLEKSPPVRVPGTAVYMSRALNVIPFAILHNLKHNKVLHERVVLLTLRTEDAPYVHNVRRVTIEQAFAHLLAGSGKLRLAGNAKYGGDFPPLRPGRIELPDDGNLVLYVPRVADYWQTSVVSAAAR